MALKTEPLSRTLVRLCSEDGATFGLGFLLREDEIVTCAHILDNAKAAGYSTVYVDFPLLDQAHKPLKTQVRVRWPQYKRKVIDVAVLSILSSESLPVGARVARIVETTHLHDHDW